MVNYMVDMIVSWKNFSGKLWMVKPYTSRSSKKNEVFNPCIVRSLVAMSHETTWFGGCKILEVIIPLDSVIDNEGNQREYWGKYTMSLYCHRAMQHFTAGEISLHVYLLLVIAREYNIGSYVHSWGNR